MASARILSVDAADALRQPGVRAVLTGSDFPQAFGTLQPAIDYRGRGGSRILTPERPLPARDRVRFVGEEIALVLADSPAAALDAAERVAVEYQELPAVVGWEGAHDVHDSVPGNVCFDFEYGDEAGTAALLDKAALRVAASVDSPRASAAPMEPRAVLAWYDAAQETYEIRCSNQGGDLMATQLASLLCITKDKVRVHPVDVGGGFGPRAGAYPEYALLLAAARRLGRPVQWTSTRSEDFLCDAHGRGIRLSGELGLDRDGKFLALKTEWLCDLGAYLTYAGARINTFNGFLIGAGPYRVRALHGRHKLVLTNCGPIDAYRGAGRPEAALIIERLVDEAAREMGIDAIELRRRNVLAAADFPYTNPNGNILDSGNPAGLLQAVRADARWNEFPARAQAAAGRGRVRGIACALFVEPCGGGFLAEDQVMLQFCSDGRILAHVATTSNGQGHETVFPEIVAGRLGIDASRIELRASDPGSPALRGNGTIGSRSTLAQGSAFLRAAEEVVEKGKTIAAGRLEAAAADLDFAHGQYRVRGTDLALSFDAMLESCKGATPHPLDTVLTQPVPRAFTSGAHVAEVEIDRETGHTALVSYVAVDDIGRVINPALAHGQIHGGVTQVAGQVVGERCLYDEAGQLLTASFTDYFMPRADTLPPLRSRMQETLSPTNALGAKGAGETGSTGGLAAIANAVADALRRAGVRRFEMPATPDRVWRALANSGSDPDFRCSISPLTREDGFMAARPLKQLPLRLHHQAFAVRDQEKTRQFMEDVLGIPLVATWCEKVFREEVGREVEYCHTFYEMADGGAVAFFQYADEECWELNRAQPAKRGDAGALHSAFKVSKETQDEIRERLKRAGIAPREIDHGYCYSLYLTSPDGVRMEFTVDAPDVDRINAMRRADAHRELKRWLSGDRRANNEDRA